MSDTSIEGVDLTGKYIVMKADLLKEQYHDVTWRVVLAKGGFGCSPRARGTAVFGTFVRDGEQGRYERHHFERLATPEEVAQAEALKEAT